MSFQLTKKGIESQQGVFSAVQHLSPSSIMCYLGDSQSFYKKWIRNEWDNTIGPSLIEGKMYHLILENYWQSVIDKKDFDWEETPTELIDEYMILNQRDFEQVDWGKTGSLEKTIGAVLTAIELYEKEKPLYEPLGVEKRITAYFQSQDEQDQPIPIKAVTDLVAKENGDLVIVDHKFVGAYKDESDPAFLIQACANYHTIKSELEMSPKKMIYDQFKKTKNRDGSPQLQRVEIFFDKETLQVFDELYQRVVWALSGRPLVDPETGQMKFLPNPYGMFGNTESWEDFKEEVSIANN